LPAGARWAMDLVTAPAELTAAVHALLAGIIVVGDLEQAARCVGDDPALKAVTVAGDLVGAHWAHGGSARPQSLLDVRAAADEAVAGVVAAMQRAEDAAELLAEATEATEAAQRDVDEARRLMQAADAAAAEISGRLGRFAGAARAATDEANRLDAAVGAARRSAEKDLAKLAQLKADLAEAEAEEERASDPELANEQAQEERSELAHRATAARNAEMEARLEVRTVEERLRAISGQADSLSATAAAERVARERAAARRRQRAAQAAVARAVAVGAQVAVAAAESSLATARARREAAEELSVTSASALKSVRVRATALAGDLDKVVSTAHGTEIARAEHRLRLEQMESHALEEYGVEHATLLAEYGPAVLVPTAVGTPSPARPAPAGEDEGKSPDEAPGDPADTELASKVPASTGSASTVPAEPGSLAEALRAVTEAARAHSNGSNGTRPRRKQEAESEVPAAVPYVREEQQKRAAEAERQLTRLGKVNPLALEEFAALQERHQFLATQLDDLRKTRRDLLTVVKEVDDRVQEVFASAYADTAREFEAIFGRLFPGGSGRLLLTEPDDMLTTGIEIEARPPGKKVKRLSLLSGGERSLTAIAYLFAIFKARPSPFYVLDEVEAALDDSNLQRLLRVFDELRESSQLIVITHQRRTMEAADALYGVSMRGDGVSQVISQRVREPEPV
jgi:chromosome segregation protein